MRHVVMQRRTLKRFDMSEIMNLKMSQTARGLIGLEDLLEISLHALSELPTADDSCCLI